MHAFVFIIMYFLFEMQEDVIVGIPDLGMAGVKWEKDIKPSIESSSYKNQIPKRGPASQGGKPVLITFENGCSLQFMAGGGNDKQRAGSTARVLVITESDDLDEISESSKEGQSKIDQLEGRVNSYDLSALKFAECTVSKDTAFTWRKYKAGTQSRIVCQCKSCLVWVSPERDDFVGWDQAETEIEAGEKAAFSCPNCGILFSEVDRQEMNLGAKLLHRGQEIDADGNVIGELPKTDTLGFRWSAFNNLLSSAELIGRKEWNVERAEDPVAAEITIKQQVWCVPAEDKQVEKVPLTIGVVRGSAAGYSGRCNGRPMWEVPDEAICLTSFVDVGKRTLNWSVNAHLPGNTRDVVAYGVTPTEQPDVIGPEEAILSGLHTVRELIEGSLDRDIDVGLVDCGYQGQRVKRANNPRRVVYEYVLSVGGPWRASMGLSTWSQKPQSDEVEPSLNRSPWYYSLQTYLGQEIWVVNFDPNSFKHQAQESYLIHPADENGERQLGSVTLFGESSKEHTEFATQLNAERFEIDHSTGKAEWKRHGANHYFDTDVGNVVARSVFDSRLIAESQDRQAGSQSPSVTLQTPDGRPFFVGSR